MGLELTIWAVGGLVLFVAAGILAAETDSGWMSTATFIIGTKSQQLMLTNEIFH